MVDSIEYCVKQTGDHVGQARGELIKAEEYRSKARKVKNIRHQTQTYDIGTRAKSKLGKSLSRVISRHEGPSDARSRFCEFRISSADMNAANS